MAPTSWLTHACPAAQRSRLLLRGLQHWLAECQGLDQSMKIVTGAEINQASAARFLRCNDVSNNLLK
jgi:hypothetical protein